MQPIIGAHSANVKASKKNGAKHASFSQVYGRCLERFFRGGSKSDGVISPCATQALPSPYKEIEEQACVLQTFIFLYHMAPDPVSMFGKSWVQVTDMALKATDAWLKLSWVRFPTRDVVPMRGDPFKVCMPFGLYRY